jgi:hypothetical protein
MIHGGSWIARSVAPLALVLALVLAAVVGACTDTSTGPTQIVSLEFDTLAFPSVMTGDTLRDSLGKVAPLHAVAFNGNGAVVANPAIKYLTLDSTVAISGRGAHHRVGRRPAVGTAHPAHLAASRYRGHHQQESRYAELRADRQPVDERVEPVQRARDHA